MIQQRNIALCIILSIVTCGIYGLYWYACDNLTNTHPSSNNTQSAGTLPRVPALLYRIPFDLPITQFSAP